MTDRLLLLDGHSLAYRAFFALPVENFATTTGQPTNAVYGFTAMLINVLRDEKPTRVAVAFDRSEPTFRHEQYVEYKAGRTKAPDEFRSQISLIFEVLDALGIRHLSAAGYEADDIIATLATQASAEGDDVLIVTGDRDTFQLIDDHVTVLYNSRGVSDMKRYDPASLVEKYGLTPAPVPRLRRPARRPERQPALHPRRRREDRDQVDRRVRLAREPGQPGRRGQGQGRRRAPREPRQRAPQPPAHPAHLRPADRDGRRRRRTSSPPPGPTATRSTTSSTPCSSGCCATGSTRPSPTASPARPPRRAGDTASKDQELGGFEVDASVLAPGQVAAWLDNHRSVERTGLALTGSWTGGIGVATAIALATPDGAGAFIDPTQLTPDDDRALAEWLADERHPKALHDAKGPIHALAAARLDAEGSQQRHRPRGLPRAARPADLRPGRPVAALPRQGAAGRGRRRRAAHAGRLRRAGGGDRR